MLPRYRRRCPPPLLRSQLSLQACHCSRPWISACVPCLAIHLGELLPSPSLQIGRALLAPSSSSSVSACSLRCDSAYRAFYALQSVENRPLHWPGLYTGGSTNAASWRRMHAFVATVDKHTAIKSRPSLQVTPRLGPPYPCSSPHDPLVHSLGPCCRIHLHLHDQLEFSLERKVPYVCHASARPLFAGSGALPAAEPFAYPDCRQRRPPTAPYDS